MFLSQAEFTGEMDGLRHLQSCVSDKQGRQAGGLKCVKAWQNCCRTGALEDVLQMGTEMVVIQNPNKNSKYYLSTKTNCFSTNRARVFHSNASSLVAFWDVSILSFLLNWRPKKMTKYVNTIHANSKCGGKWLLYGSVFFSYICPVGWRVDLSCRSQLFWLWITATSNPDEA